jgi:hypothetical protein
VADLPLNTPTQATLDNNKDLYYKLEIPQNLANETLLLTLQGDVQKGANEIYLRHGEVPTRAVHDFAYGQAFQANQEIVVPELRAGTYYLLVYGSTTAGPTQPITLEAKILNYELRSVNAGSGGNTGQVTVEISGSKLGTVKSIRLTAAGKPTLEAFKTVVIDPTKVFATFNLEGATLGDYDVVAENRKGETTELKQGFKVVAGTAANLLTSVTTPPSTRPSNVLSFTVQYTNAGNTDIRNPVLQLSSLAGAPIAFNVADLDKNTKELTLTLLEAGGPVGILRPGASGTIVVYAKATTALSFTLLKPDSE